MKEAFIRQQQQQQQQVKLFIFFFFYDLQLQIIESNSLKASVENSSAHWAIF